MREWFLDHWNIVVGLTIFAITIIIYSRDIKKRQLTAQSHKYSNQMPAVIKDADVVQEELLKSLHDEPPLKLVQEPTHIDIPILKTTGQKALQTWADLRSVADKTGFWPVILGDRSDLETAGVRLSDMSEPIEKTFIDAQLIDVKKWFRAKITKNSEYNKVTDGEWSEDAHGANDFLCNLEVSRRQPIPEVFIALVPTKSFWEVPVYLHFGGWSDIPLPEENVAILKYWNELYGAELVALKSDTIELHVKRPPSQKATAIQLAEEQIAYCRDTYADYTLRALGSNLHHSSTWYFWWD